MDPLPEVDPVRRPVIDMAGDPVDYGLDGLRIGQVFTVDTASGTRTHVALDERGIPTEAEESESAEAEPIGRRTFDDLYRLGRGRDLALLTDDVAIAVARRTPAA